MSSVIKIGGACLNQTPFDWEANLRNIKNAVNQAKKDGIDILCLPELCVTGYGCEDLFLSPWLLEKALEKLELIIEWTDGIAISVGLPVQFDSNIYNTTCFISNKEIKGFYAKHKLANDGVHYEPRWFTSWESGRTVKYNYKGSNYPFGHILLDHKGLKIGFEICEDAWREDRPASQYQSKLDLLLNPSASHFAFKKAKFREELVCNSSRQLECVYLYANLLGNEAGRMIYDGDILIANKGKLIARNSRLSFEDFKLLAVSIDFNSGKNDDFIMPDIEDQNEEFTMAASLALFDYLRKSKSRGFVLSLSGGADSGTLATLISEVVARGLAGLGKKEFEKKLGFKLNGENQKEIVNQLLTTAYQGTQNSSDKTFNSAKKLAESIGGKFYSWKIDDQVESYRTTIEDVIGRKLSWNEDDITLQNIQARARSPIIWMLANLNNALLLATSKE
jgi:NAD+ synthase (glutamine-hydrolysing)